LGDPNRWDCSHKSLSEAGEKIPVINYTKQYVLLELFCCNGRGVLCVVVVTIRSRKKGGHEALHMQES
jgi:hypothetical protein